MRQASGVDDGVVEVALVQSVDERALVIGLEEGDLESELGGMRRELLVDLVQRLTKQRVDFEELIIPDDTHHFFRHANWVTVDSATAAYFERKFGPSGVKAAAEKR
jgi:hypothetical protein